MKTTLICPTYNEEESIEELINSMLNQSKKPDEIIFVDSFSRDKTAEIIKKYSKKNKEIKLIQEKSNIAQARNIAIKNAKHEIIAATDASSKLDKDWLKNIVKPFKDKSIDVVGGGYINISDGGVEDYIAMLTVKPISEWDEKTFLPSGRSIAFKRTAWKKVGGYPVSKREKLDAGEDTLFDIKLKKAGFKFKLAKDAIVYWKSRDTAKKFAKQFFRYGRGDVENGNLKHIRKNLVFFLGVNLWLFLLITSIILKPMVSLVIIAPIILYLLLSGIKYTIKKKRIGCLFWIPILLFLKRFSYFFGVWKGLLR